MKILLMGPRINRKNPLLIGGAIAAFENLIEQFDKNSLDYDIIDTNKSNYSNIILAYLYIIKQSFFKQNYCTHISLHSSKDYLILGLIIIFIGKIFDKKTSLRKFGGEASDVYKKSKGVKKIILNIIYSHIDVLFFETRHIVQFFSRINKNSFWFPNSRNRILEPILPRTFNKKFVFIGHVHQEKGIDMILETSMYLDENYDINIYGPITDKKYSKDFFESYNVAYHGALDSKDVIKKLNTYDVLLLPSYKEGYPGVIIEAYSLGIPIISTNLKNIKEIVDQNETGILVDPGNTEELIKAIKFFKNDNYEIMSQNAYKKFDNFDSELQTKHFLERITYD